MKIQDLEEKINLRANEVVQAKINVFKGKIDAALTELFGNSNVGGEKFGEYGYFEGNKQPHCEIARCKLEVLKLAIQQKTGGEVKTLLPWPAILWNTERERTRNELLEKMDLLQKLLMTKDRKDAGDDVPEGEW